MDHNGAETSARVTSHPPVGTVWWALVFGALSTASLAVLTGALLVLHALAYGAVTVIAPGAGPAAPDLGRYGLALAVGVVVHLATASASSWLASRTAIRARPAVAESLGTSLLAASAAACALLLTLGISPVALLLDR